MRKPLYFVTTEKKVNHIGFFTKTEIELLESEESLERLGFQKNPFFLRETGDSVYIFSSFLPQSIIERWCDQILKERSEFKRGMVKEPKGVKIKERKMRIVKHSKSKRPLPRGKPRRTSRRTVRKVQKPQISQIKMTPPKRKKTLDMLKEEVRARRIWDSFVPVCSECSFWEKQVLRLTQVETGECTVTRNIVSPDKKACSEFQRK